MTCGREAGKWCLCLAPAKTRRMQGEKRLGFSSAVIVEGELTGLHFKTNDSVADYVGMAEGGLWAVLVY